MASNHEGKPGPYTLVINGKPYQSAERFLTGKEILELAGLRPPKDYQLLMRLHGREYEPVELDEKKDLKEGGIEEFEASFSRNFKIFVDDEPYHVHQCFMTPVEILALRKLSPDGYYVKQVDGHKSITYKEDMEHRIPILDCMVFSTCKKAPTPVSFQAGHAVMAVELEAMGYKPITYPGKEQFVGFKFKVPHGRFYGQEIEIALSAPQFPIAPPAGIFVSPRFLPAKSGNQHPFDGITDQTEPRSDFQYWSRRFDGWGAGGAPKNMQEYVSYIRTLFDFD